MAVTLRLKRFGRLNHPTYRVVATDPRFPRDGRIIESLGYYLPLMPRAQEQLKLNTERVQYWLSVGAKPSETVATMIERSGLTVPTPKKPERKKGKGAPAPFVPPKKKVRKSKADKRAAKAAKEAAGGKKK
ncbi:MAG: 30S ribosomal protein S16 [Planctomycetes bacterium]|nr:30S ribosomal protein S16 [Planctomycetota bacterium]